MKISDIIDLAKAGYKPSDVLKLLEYVETSPAVKEAASITPDEVPENTTETTPAKAKAEEKVDDLEKLKSLLED
jgi:predicted flap endonuclease-1-like 5' DNA nuclease